MTRLTGLFVDRPQYTLHAFMRSLSYLLYKKKFLINIEKRELQKKDKYAVLNANL